MNRLLLAGPALVACVGVVVLRPGPSPALGPDARVEQRLRNTLTRPGPDQIAPNGERPKSISCREHGDRRRICSVDYPSGRRLRCLVGERPLDQGPHLRVVEPGATGTGVSRAAASYKGGMSIG